MANYLIAMNQDFQGNQLLNPVIHQGSAAPTAIQEGQLYTNTSSHGLYAYLNSTWQLVESGLGNPGTNGWVLSSTTAGVRSWVAMTAGFSNPMNTAGDLMYENATPVAARLPIGSTGNVLIVASGMPAWSSLVLTNNAATLTLATGSTLATSGAYSITLTASSATNVTLPTSGTLVGSNDTGTVTNTMLAGSIANAKLLNSSVTIGSTSVSLGATVTSFAGIANFTHLAGTTTVAPINFSTSGSVVLTTAVIGALEWDQNNLYITNSGPTRRTLLYADFSNIGSTVISGTNGGTGVNNGSKTITLGGNLTTTGAYNTSFTQQGSFTFILPPQAGTLISTGDTGTVTNAMLAGSIAVGKLATSNLTIGSTSITLGNTQTTLAGLAGLTFIAGTLTQAPLNFVTGVATLTTPVVGAMQFDGSNLYIYNTGPTYRTIAYADFSNITSGTKLGPTFGGTGANNGSFTITVGGNFNAAGTFTVTAGNVSIANGLSTTGTFSSGGNFSTGSTFSTVGAFATAGAFSTTGAFSTSLTQGANLTLVLPVVAGTATMLYYTSAPAAQYAIPYAGGASGLMSYTAVGAYGTLVCNSAGLPSWATGTGVLFTANGTSVPAFTTAITGCTYNGISVTSGTGTLTLSTYTLSITGNLSTTAAFSTTGTGSLVLANGSVASTVTMPGVTTATLLYDTANPTQYQIPYASSTTGAMTWAAMQSGLAVLCQTSNGTAPAFVTATGTGAPVLGTGPTMTNVNVSGATTTINIPSGASFTVASGATFTSLNTPVNSTDIVNKGYVDAVAQGMYQKPTARLATAGYLNATQAYTYANGTAGVGATLTNNGTQAALVIDGIACAVNDIVLVMSEIGANAPYNGLYTVTNIGSVSTNWVLTRQIDMDQSTEIVGAFIPVDKEGTANKNTLWLCSTIGAVTVGTTNITFTQLNGACDLIAYSTGLGISGNTISLNGFSASTFTQYGLFYAGTTTAFAQIALPGAANQVLVGATGAAPSWGSLIITPTGGSNATLAIAAGKTLTVSNNLTFTGTDGISVAFGGYNLTFVTAGVTTVTFSGSGSIAVPTKYTTTITGAGPTYTITHSLNTKNIAVFVYDNNDNLIGCGVVCTSTTQCTLTMGYGAPGANIYRVVVLG